MCPRVFIRIALVAEQICLVVSKCFLYLLEPFQSGLTAEKHCLFTHLSGCKSGYFCWNKWCNSTISVQISPCAIRKLLTQNLFGDEIPLECLDNVIFILPRCPGKQSGINQLQNLNNQPSGMYPTVCINPIWDGQNLCVIERAGFLYRISYLRYF